MAIDRNFKRRIVLILLILFWWASAAQATVPLLINYQGNLTDELGSPVDGTYTIQFYLYDDAIGGASQWDEEQDVTVTGGIYNVHLGSVNALNADIFMVDALYLEVLVYNTNTSLFEVLSPRQLLTSVPFAIQAGSTPDGAVTTIMLADEAVTEAKVAAGAITADKIDGGVGSGVDADLLDGQSAEDFLSVAGGTVTGTLAVQGSIGPQLVIHDRGSVAERPGIQFTGNNIHFIAGDDLSDELFGFYAGYSNTRVHDAKLRVYGKATDNWERYISLTHDGTDGTIETDSGDLILAPATDVRLAAGKGVVYPDGTRQTTAYTTALEARVTALENEVNALKALLLNVTRAGDDIHFNGVNLHVNNGTGTTNGTVNGLGNLIVGYNELRGSGDDRTGSHNIVSGTRQNYTAFGGLVVGVVNTISAPYATVSGGISNTASGEYASVSGGHFNTASALASSVSGGLNRTANDIYDWRAGDLLQDY